MSKRLTLYFLSACYSLSLSAQQWQYAGDTVACDFAALYPYVGVNKNNEAYLLYRDMSNIPEKTMVKKFNGTSWVNVGGPSTIGHTMPPCLAFDTAGLPYVAATSSRLTVARFDGINWILVGSAGFISDDATSLSLKIAPDNTPYVAFRDFAHNENISVMKFDGSNWVYVGQPGFTPNHPQPYHGAWRPSLAFNQSGTPYIAYIDITNGWRLSVMKFNGSNWVYVGTSNISGGTADLPTLVIDSQGSPVVGYTDGNAQVKKFNGTSWVSVGVPAFASGVDYTMLAIDRNDGLYFVYTSSGKANVMEYHGSNWTQCGNADFHPNAHYTTIGINEDGTCLYVGLQDGKDFRDSTGGIYHIVSVMKLERTASAGRKENTSFTFNAFPNPTGSNVHISYSPQKAERAVLRVTSASGQLVYQEDFTGSYDKAIDLSPFTKGIYFIEIRSGRNSAKRKVLLQ